MIFFKAIIFQTPRSKLEQNSEGVDEDKHFEDVDKWEVGGWMTDSNADRKPGDNVDMVMMCSKVTRVVMMYQGQCHLWEVIVNSAVESQTGVLHGERSEDEVCNVDVGDMPDDVGVLVKNTTGDRDVKMTSMMCITGNDELLSTPPPDRTGSKGRVQNCNIDKNKMCTVYNCGTRVIKVSSKKWVYNKKTVLYGYRYQKTNKLICIDKNKVPDAA